LKINKYLTPKKIFNLISKNILVLIISFKIYENKEIFIDNIKTIDIGEKIFISLSCYRKVIALIEGLKYSINHRFDVMLYIIINILNIGKILQIK
jgi:hypothetical protein